MVELPESGQAGAYIEITEAMINAGVSALYSEMGYQLGGSVSAGVEAVLRAALCSCVSEEVAKRSIDADQ